MAGFIIAPHNYFDVETGRMERLHQMARRRLLSPITQTVTECVASYTSYGAIPTQADAKNNSISIDDVRMFWSLFKKAHIISSSGVSDSINLQIDILAKVISKLELERAPEIEAIKKLKAAEDIFYNSERRSYTTLKDEYKSILSPLETKSLINKLIEELNQQMKEPAVLISNKFPSYYIGSLFLNAVYAFYCHQMNIDSTSSAACGCLLTFTALMRQLFFVPKNKACKDVKSKLEEILYKLESSVEMEKFRTELREEVIEKLDINKERMALKIQQWHALSEKQDRRKSEPISPITFSLEMTRSRQKSVDSNISDTTLYDIV